MTHKETVALNNLNAGIKDIADVLCEAYEKFRMMNYDALAELGHSESMHELGLSFEQLINEFNNTKFTETDFPDCNEEAYDECADIKEMDEEAAKEGLRPAYSEYTKDDYDADRGDNESYPEQI